VADNHDLGDDVVALRFSPNGQLLVTVTRSGRIDLRDPETFEVSRSLLGTGGVEVVDGPIWFSGDGRHTLIAGDGAARLWNLEIGAQVGDVFPNDPDIRIGGQDGAPRLITGVGDHFLVWNVDPDTWPAIACRAAGRNMTLEEWEQFGPQGEPYRATCPEWPTLG